MIKKNFLTVLNYHSLLHSPSSLLLMLFIIVVVLVCFFLGCNTPVLASLGIHSKTSFSDNPSVNLVVLRKVSLIRPLSSGFRFRFRHSSLVSEASLESDTGFFEIKSNLCLFGFKISE